MIERRIKAARFPVVKSLDAFDFKVIASLNKMLVLELARCEHIDRHENVISARQQRHRQDPHRPRSRAWPLARGVCPSASPPPLPWSTS